MKRSDGTKVEWERGGKKDVLQTYINLHEGKIGMHWLWAAVERIARGESEAEVMADYGYTHEETTK